MKVVVRFFTLKIFIVAFCLFVATPVFAQDLVKECQTIYDSFPTKDKNLTVDDYKKSIAVRKKYLEKCSNIKGKEEVTDYLIKQIPRLEIVVRDMELFNRFNDSVPHKNWDETFASGEEIIQKLNYPDVSLDVTLILASIGFDNVTTNPPNDKYNDEAIKYANLALQKMSEGVTSENYGAFIYTYKTKECPDGKLNATGWMNYTIGYIMYVRQNHKKESLSLIYQSTQIGCETKKLTEPYRVIGDWYLDEFNNLEAFRLEKIKVAGNQETDETKSILALEKGYAERALDAYARIFKIYTTRITENITYKADLRKKAERVYKFLFEADLTGFDSYLKNVANTPFVDPATPINPKSKN